MHFVSFASLFVVVSFFFFKVVSIERSLFDMKNSIQGTHSEERDGDWEGQNESGNDGHDEILQQQVEVEERVPSPPTLPCSPLSRPRAILATSE